MSLFIFRPGGEPLDPVQKCLRMALNVVIYIQAQGRIPLVSCAKVFEDGFKCRRLYLGPGASHWILCWLVLPVQKCLKMSPNVVVYMSAFEIKYLYVSCSVLANIKPQSAARRYIDLSHRSFKFKLIKNLHFYREKLTLPSDTSKMISNQQKKSFTMTTQFIRAGHRTICQLRDDNTTTQQSLRKCEKC